MESLRTSKATNRVRDLNEALGKLPPQAIDLEEAILGALMLESQGYDQVKDILQPSHFYKEDHKEIYIAIHALKSASAPVDMRTVVHQLSKTGKLELIGGAYFIAELTSKVSSAANIEYHARCVVEMAMKREVIQLASRINNEAYDDTTDVFKLLESVQSRLSLISNQNVTEPKEAKIKNLWKDILLEEEPPEETPILFIDGVPVATPGNHSLLIGKKKSRKTLFLTWLVVQYLNMPGTKADEVVFFDTEQGKSHVWKIRKKVERMTGKKIPVLYLRGRSPEERREIIEGTLSFWPTKIKLAFIDGVRDCVSNINDIDECTDLIVWLEKQTLMHNVHICNVLHMNKGDTNARGHLGTELANKAQTSIELTLNEKANCTEVKCESSRDKPFTPFAFTHGVDDLPEIIGLPTQEGNEMSSNDEHNRIRLVFEDTTHSYAELIDAVKAHFACGGTVAKRHIARWQHEGWVIKSGKSHSKDSRYSLITKNFSKLPPMEEVHPPQEELFDSPPISLDDMPF